MKLQNEGLMLLLQCLLLDTGLNHFSSVDCTTHRSSIYPYVQGLCHEGV